MLWLRRLGVAIFRTADTLGDPSGSMRSGQCCHMSLCMAKLTPGKEAGVDRKVSEPRAPIKIEFREQPCRVGKAFVPGEVCGMYDLACISGTAFSLGQKIESSGYPASIRTRLPSKKRAAPPRHRSGGSAGCGSVGIQNRRRCPGLAQYVPDTRHHGAAVPASKPKLLQRGSSSLPDVDRRQLTLPPRHAVPGL
jgi:hypothetical protein